ncbi:MAG: DNA polymerase I [Ruthenibacterium sp.]
MKLLVLDGNSIINRAFYGIKLLTTKDGRFTNAIVGFMNILQKLLGEENPDEVAVAFDLRAPTFRHKMYDGYKAGRKGMPEELAAQMPILKELLCDLGYKIVTCEGYEADDILGTLAAACHARGDMCVLATGDRDSLQLIGPNVKVLLASTFAGKSNTLQMDEAAVFEKYGVAPKQLIEVKSLMGDASDNIPGVAGIGEKTALTLIQDFATLAGVYEQIDDARIKKGVREKLLRDKEQAEMSRVLAEINCAVPVDSAVGTYRKDAPDIPKTTALLVSLEMYGTLEKLHLNDAPTQLSMGENAAEIPQIASVSLPKLEGLVYLCVTENSVLIVQNDNIYTSSIDSVDLLHLLADATVEKRCFDAKPLYRAAFAAGKTARNITFDAKLAAYLLNPAASSYTVVRLAQEYGIVAAFAGDLPEAGVLAPLCDILRKKIDADGMTMLLDDIEMPLCEVLASMEHHGILVDKNGIEIFGQELQKVLTTELAAIYDAVGYEFNVNSPKQLGKALFEDLGLPTRKKTKSGYSTNAETLESLRHYSPVIDHILLYRTYQKLNSTYVEGLLKVIGADGRIHSTFNQTETRTGRISSGEPNLQNIPVRTELGSRLRKYFIAAPNETLLDADYSQIELRILSHIADDKAMQEAFLTGQDIHRSTAAKIYGVSPEQVTPAMRSSAKAVNFGIVYGIGAFSLAKDINVSVKEADAFIKTYLGNFPNVKKYMDSTIEQGRENGYVSTLYGRRRALPELASGNFNLRSLGERMAMNTPIQGTAADIIKLAMVRVYRRLQAENLEARLILQVHDELIVECPISETEKAAKILGEEMQNAASLRVPLSAEVNRGETWYDAKG